MAEDTEVGSGSSDCKDKIVEKLLFKNLNRAISYLSYNIKQKLMQLKQAFTKTSILQTFDIEYYMQIETHVSGYTIKNLLSQITNLD